MDGKEYTEFTATTNRYPEEAMLLCLLAGLTSEVGEVADKIKKAYRDNNATIEVVPLLHEMGDCVWYLSELARLAGSNLGEVMSMNVRKLTQRVERGTIHGSGDNR